MRSLRFLNIKQLSSLIKKKEISPVEILKETLENLNKLETKLNSFAHLDVEGAKKLAAESEKRMLSNKLISDLDGIPTSIKDLVAQKDMPLRFGSKTTPDKNCEVDAPSVERLRNAGAVLLGKSTTSELDAKQLEIVLLLE